tara:strand:- start:1479 stop:1655 length:177 start_codon:yes stop_codon:yes gene_type:complete
MKKQELYNIIIGDKEVYTGLNQYEYFQRMEDYALEYYQTGSPHPDKIKTETYLEDMNG